MGILIKKAEVMRVLLRIDEELKREIDTSSPLLVANKLSNIALLIGNIPTCIASVRYLLDKAKQKAYEETERAKYAPSILKDIINSSVAEETSMLEICNGMESALRHQSDIYRTLLSYLKEELRQTPQS